MSNITKLTELIEPEAKALGFDLVRVQFVGSGDDYSLQIMAERPDTRQLTITDCAELSRRLSEKFDMLEEAGQGPVSEPYRLEVSSPGIDRPLTRLTDYNDWSGHEAKAKLQNAVSGRKTLVGPIIGVEGETIIIEDRKTGPQKTVFANITSAKLVLTDALIAATAPLIDDAADAEIELEDDSEEEQA